MANLISITIDCEDPQRLAGFWTIALDGFMADEGGTVLKSDSGLMISFQKVPEPKTAKNCMHLDLITKDPKGEIFRLERLGAKVVEEKEEGGRQWVVMSDLEGNEFCVGVA